MIDRVRRELSAEDIAKIANTYHRWRDKPEVLNKKGLEPYADDLGFCKAVRLDVVREHDYVLTPGRYVGARTEESDDVPFEERFAALRELLEEQFVEGRQLESKIVVAFNGVEIND